MTSLPAQQPSSSYNQSYDLVLHCFQRHKLPSSEYVHAVYADNECIVTTVDWGGIGHSDFGTWGESTFIEALHQSQTGLCHLRQGSVKEQSVLCRLGSLGQESAISRHSLHNSRQHM